MRIARLATLEDLQPIKSLLIEKMTQLTSKFGSYFVITWLKWFVREGFVALIEEDGKIVSVAMGRPTEDASKSSDDWWYFNPRGDTIYVDQFVGDKTGFMDAILLGVKRFGGEIKKIAFDTKSSDRTRILSINDAQRLFGQPQAEVIL